jgi:hypothetical protein
MTQLLHYELNHGRFYNGGEYLREEWIINEYIEDGEEDYMMAAPIILNGLAGIFLVLQFNIIY